MKKTVIIYLLSLLIISIYTQEIDFSEHIVADNYLSSWSIFAIDMDNDGDNDILSSSKFSNKVTWWENDGNLNFFEHTISNSAFGAMGIYAGDIDNDSDNDVVCACDFGNKISWWENIDNNTFVEHVVTNWVGANYTFLGYVNDDDDLDILGTACDQQSNKIGWFENDGSQNYTEYIVKDNWDHANSIYAIDLDQDIDTDILGTASWEGEIFWFENDGDENFTENLLFSSTIGRPSCVIANDLDSDGDNDVIATICQTNQVIWLENDGQNNFTQNIIGTGFDGPHSVSVCDINNDGFQDYVCASILNNEVTWWENDGNENFIEHVISNQAVGATDIFPIDMDIDGDIDVVGSARDGNQILWWENKLFIVDFIADQITGNRPLEISFTDLSNFIEPITAWMWDFNNDGDLDSFEQHPSWTYEEPGLYSVSLTVLTGEETKSILKEDYIQVFNGHTALEFNLQDSHVICPSETSVEITEAFTIESWIYPYSYGSTPPLGLGRIFDKSVISFFLNNEIVLYPDNCLVLEIQHADGTISSSTTLDNSITLNEWSHVAFSYDGIDQVRMFINGDEVITTQPTAPTGILDDNCDEDIYLGNISALNRGFDGIIDEVRLWNYFMDEDEIQENMNKYLHGTENGLIHYWQFNEGNGTSIVDIANNNNGEIYQIEWIQGVELDPVQVKPANIIPSPITLKCYPNPFNPTTTILFNLDSENIGNSEIIIYNLKGQKVRAFLINSSTDQSVNSVTWNGTDQNNQPVASGIYFCELITEGFQKSMKMILMK